MGQLLGNTVGGGIQVYAFQQLNQSAAMTCPDIVMTNSGNFDRYTFTFNNCMLNGGTLVDGNFAIELLTGGTLLDNSMKRLFFSDITVNGYDISFLPQGSPPPANRFIIFNNSEAGTGYVFNYFPFSDERFRIEHPDYNGTTNTGYTEFIPANNDNTMSNPSLTIEVDASMLDFTNASINAATYNLTVHGIPNLGQDGRLWRGIVHPSDGGPANDFYLKTEDGSPLVLRTDCNKVIDGVLEVRDVILGVSGCAPTSTEIPIARSYSYGYAAGDDCMSTPAASPICDNYVKIEYCSGECRVVECN